MRILLLAVSALSIVLSSPASAAELVAATYETLGIKRWSQLGKVHVSVQIKADTDDPQAALYSGIRVAKRLASDRRIDFVRVFTRTKRESDNKVARIQHAEDPSDLPVMRGKEWDLMVFWRNEEDRARL